MQILLSTLGALVLIVLVVRGVLSFFPKDKGNETTIDTKQ